MAPIGITLWSFLLVLFYAALLGIVLLEPPRRVRDIVGFVGLSVWVTLALWLILA